MSDSPPVRPAFSTAEELRAARLDLADSKIFELPQKDINALLVYNVRELRAQTSERDAALFSELSAIRQQGAASAGRAGASAFWAKFSGLAFPTLMFLITFGGEWGKTHPEGFGGVGALLVALSAAVARFGSGKSALNPQDPPTGAG